MENFGSEIGQKMRSAVKAKLLELGTGGSTGYIDDELPDYVMIMVANKRSKQQMIADLNLFLGNQTDLFVTWLHEVLHKLQEVTLPATSATTKKRKTSQKEDANSKKDKKANKKKTSSSTKKQSEEASTSAEAAEKPTTTTSNVGVTLPVISSITDVFAEDLLEKAKKSQDVTSDAAAHIKKGKGRKTVEQTTSNAVDAISQQAQETNDFDIPTISEISSTTGSGAASGSGNREKDLAELAEIQKKIYAAKKHLKHLGEFEEAAESEDEDFLNLKDDGSADEFNEAGDLVKKAPAKAKSPIVFDKNEREHEHDPDPVVDENGQDNDYMSSKQRRRLTPPPLASAAVKAASLLGGREQRNTRETTDDMPSSRRSRERERREAPGAAVRKRPVHERLGMKTLPRETPREAQRERRIRQEKELYVPAFRRRELENERDRERDRDCDRGERERDRDKDRNRESERGERGSRGREQRLRRSSPEQPTSSSASAATNVNRQAAPSSSKSATEIIANTTIESKRTPSVETQRQRIGSRVIVAPAKPVEQSDEEDLNEKPINSVIRIKPRQPMSPSKQACKNLLLRAVAEAQRSTIQAKSKKEPPSSAPKVSARLGELVINPGDRNTKLYTKSFRDRLKRSAATSTSNSATALIRRTTQNLVIEVKSSLKNNGGKRRRLTSSGEHNLDDEDEYVPEVVSSEDRGESDAEYVYVPQPIHGDEHSGNEHSFEDAEKYDARRVPEVVEFEEDDEEQAILDNITLSKTQFVVTLNDDKTPPKYKKTRGSGRKAARSRSVSPLPQVSSSTTRSHSRSRDTHSSKQDIKMRLSLKATSSLSPSTAARLSERESSNSSPSSNTPPQPRRTELIEVYRKPKDIKKIIIKNDSEDEELSPKKCSPDNPRKSKRHSAGTEEATAKDERSNTPPLPPAKKRLSLGEDDELKKSTTSTSTPSPLKRKRTPIKFDLIDKDAKERDREDGPPQAPKRRGRESTSLERRSGDEHRRISIRTAEVKKYDNIPSLSSLALDTKVAKPKERCKYHPNCTKQFCEFYHPSAPCKSFPNCKYADKCMYSHPKCKYDTACTILDCNFSHSGPRNLSLLQPTAPPLSSHVVPVQNYKSISVAPAASSAMCKYYPNCQKVGCTFYHPKPCRFGKNCINKLECNFYHHEIQSSSKFKWVASIV